MKTEVREVSPLVAEKMLEKNYNNRNVTKSNVTFLSKQMEDGKWLFDGQPIRFDSFGRLLDGQHRLNAIIKSGTTQKFLIVSGIESESFKVMDTGKNRSSGDALSVLGVSYANSISAGAKKIIKHYKGTHGKNNSGYKITNTDVVNWYEDNKGVVDVAKNCLELSKSFSNVIPSSYLIYLTYVFSDKNVLDAEKFIKELCYGSNSDLKSPSNTLRRLLISDKLSKSSMSPEHKNAIIFKAWNSFRKNKSISFLRWNKDVEKFPNLI